MKAKGDYQGLVHSDHMVFVTSQAWRLDHMSSGQRRLKGVRQVSGSLRSDGSRDVQAGRLEAGRLHRRWGGGWQKMNKCKLENDFRQPRDPLKQAE
jgi:hypothetical protein